MEHSGTGPCPSRVLRRYLKREFTPWSEKEAESFEVVTVAGPVRVERREG
jgi:hypothetical protein